MEPLEMQTEIISLGKSLVKELKLDNSVDTLGRWMSHYLAELMVKAENASGREKAKLEKECFDCILALWKHRWLLPHGSRPLEDFEPLLNMLQKLNPENKDPYFYSKIPNMEKTGRKTSSKKDAQLDIWLKTAEKIDKIARIWLNEVFHQAAESALSAKSKKWLESAVPLPNDHDRQIIIKIVTEKSLDLDDLEDEEKMEELNGRLSKETIEERIRHLNEFKKLNQILIDNYRSQLI
jgi:hypothetical protein